MTNEELDRLAAEKIMEIEGKYRGDGDWVTYDEKTNYTTVTRYQPTRNIAQAFELLEKLDKNFAVTKLGEPQGEKKYNAKVFVRTEKAVNYSNSDSAPLAIVLACLRSLGLEIDDD